jgi:hypothetical protein
MLSCVLLADGGNLGISKRLSNTPLAVPSACPITFKSISQRLLAKTEQFLSIFPEGPIFY